MCSYLVRGYISIADDDVHWYSINWYVDDISLSLVPSSIIYSLHDIIHEDLNVGDGSIKCQFEWNYGLFIDGNVSFGGVVQD